MILTITANPAIDVTYAVPLLEPGTAHRVTAVLHRAGGKGINAARILHALGEEVQATGLSGGPNGRWLDDELRHEGITSRFVDALPDLRRTVVVQTQDSTTSFWEPGPRPADPRAAAEALLLHTAELVQGCGAVLMSGSLPPGVSTSLPSRVAELCYRAGVPVVLDVDGDSLVAAGARAPAVLMPNGQELATLIGVCLTDPGEVAAAVQPLLERSPLMAVVVTLGREGVVAVWRGGAASARPPERLTGNATGAGDAAAAAVVRQLGHAGSPDKVDWSAVVCDAVATSAASVLRPAGGELDLAARCAWAAAIRPVVVLEET